MYANSVSDEELQILKVARPMSEAPRQSGLTWDNCECGRPNNQTDNQNVRRPGRIVGGYQATFLEEPWMVRLYIRISIFH